MTIEEHYKKMVDFFKVLPDPVHEPLRFAWYVRMYKFYIDREG